MSDVDKLMTEILGERPNVKDRALRELINARMKKGGAVVMAEGGKVQAAPYGLRETSGMPKGKGYFGELPTAGGVMTELSASDDAGDFPLIVPTLTAAELKHLQSGGEPTAEIYAKAKAWAESRKGQGRDPFATSEDLRMPVPEYANGGAVMMKRGGKAKGETLASMDTGKVEMRKAPGAEKAERILSGAAEFLPFVGAGKAAAEGDYPSAALQGALDVAGGPLLKGAAALGGKAIPALAGIFIGPKSKLWNKASAMDFLKLEKAGVAPEEAWKQTGTFRSPDGILRQEINDKPSRLRRERMMDLEDEYQDIRARSEAEQKRLLDAVASGEMTKEAADAEWENILRSPLDDRRVQIAMDEYPAARKLAMPGKKVGGKDPQLVKTLHHPEAFEAYPKLKYLKTEYRVDPSVGPLGEKGYLTSSGGASWSASDAPKLFSLGQSTPRARNIMLHEMQHAIQRLEGMGLGGNPNMEWGMLPSQMHPTDYVKQLQDAQKRLMDERFELEKTITPEMRARPYDDPHPDVVRSAALGNRLRELQNALRGLGGNQFEPLYQRMAGEAEARAVQKRMDMTPEERRATFPLESYDVPIEELVVRQEPYKAGGEVHAKDGGDDWEKLKRLTPFYGAKPEPVDAEEQGAKRRLRELEGRVLERDYIEPQSDDLEAMVRRGLRSGLGKVMSPEGSKRSADILTDVASFVALPMLGFESGQALGRAYEAGRSGDYGEAALEGGLGVLGVLAAVPGIGVAARGAERAANIGSTAIRRPFTPATLTVEATAPDLGQGASYGFRQGLNDVLLQDIAAGRKAREGTGVFKSEITKRLETNPMLAVDIPRAGRIGEMAGSNDALRREIAQAGVDLNQEAMAAHRFIPLLTNRPEDASAMLIKTKGGLTGEEIVQLASRLGNEMVVTHNPRLGGVVIYPFGPVGKGGAPEFGVAKKATQEILGKKGKIQYGVADYDKDRLFMEQVEGDYQRAGAKKTSPEKAERRQKLQELEKFMFPESTSGIPGNVKASPLGGLQPWSRGREYPTHVQGIGTKPDWRAVNYATEGVGQRRPTYAEAEKGREALLERWHRTLPGKVR